MEKGTLEELDIAIRKCIVGMKKVEIFDSHAVLNHVFFSHRALYDKMVKEDKPRTPGEWISFRRRIYARVKASSNDLIEVVSKKQSWSVLFDGSFGPCTYWRKLTKVERDSIKTATTGSTPRRGSVGQGKRKSSNAVSPKARKNPK